jgi:hypothetical protein
MLCVFVSSFHPLGELERLSLSSILFIHLKEKPMVGIFFFLSNSKIKEKEKKTKKLSL